ncbi:hypothetical protein Airi02_084800 [Actinoallomurus iriomotensis]|uniref:Uncharacterized protein n=1 Tax=Actinoallomurus iriomotensis TaxID=478107 RepID=A0A9W6S8P9_9ACTN|nr:hypothetical protein Airi02_084800 [Actinoallomurus iriomotensis]
MPTVPVRGDDPPEPPDVEGYRPPQPPTRRCRRRDHDPGRFQRKRSLPAVGDGLYPMRTQVPFTLSSWMAEPGRAGWWGAVVKPHADLDGPTGVRVAGALEEVEKLQPITSVVPTIMLGRYERSCRGLR